MLLIKYYSFDEKKSTCYDGMHDFTLPAVQKRFYPNEYLTANILEKYLSSQSSRIKQASKKIIVLTEKWFRNGGTRNGTENTDSFNAQIFEAIKKAESDREVENTLIIVPFLYGCHNPGAVIDVKNKMIIYLAPFGPLSPRLRGKYTLREMANANNFNFQSATAVQHEISQDESNSGPILTLSMIKFIEEFLKNGSITKEGFETPRRNIATDRMFQMYVNNTQKIKEEKSALNEIMFADESLWESFFFEQQLKDLLGAEILEIVSQQKIYIEKLRGITISSFDLEKIQSFCDFQSRLTELIFINPPGMQSKIKILINEGKRALNANEMTISDLSLLTPPINLLQRPNLNCVLKNLRLETFINIDEDMQDLTEEKASNSIILSHKPTISEIFEEEIFKEYEAEHLENTELLRFLDCVLKNHDQTTSTYKAAQCVYEEAENLLREIPDADTKKWKMSVVLTLNLLETPIKSPEYPNAVKLLHEHAKHRAIGKANGWAQFKGALAMLAGAAIIGLSIAGVPFTGGASLAGFYVGGGLLLAGGAAFFYHNRQKSLAKASAKLANDASKQPIQSADIIANIPAGGGDHLIPHKSP